MNPLWRIARHYVRHVPPQLVNGGLVERADHYLSHANAPFEARLFNGLRVRGNTGDIIERYIYLFGFWEPALTDWLGRRLKPGDGFIDVGANIGIAIEASPNTFDRLRENVALNSASNVHPTNLAASDVRGTVRLFDGGPANRGATSEYPAKADAHGVDVQCMPLSEIVPNEAMRKVRAIKIDVEGAETKVVRGLLPLLREARNDLEFIVEVGGGPKGSPSAIDAAGELFEMLRPESFKCYRLRNNYAARSYRTVQKGRLERISVPASIRFECDLIFSRVDPSTALLPVGDMFEPARA